MSASERNRPWTPEEDRAVRSLYPNVTNQTLADLIGRSEPAVSNRACKLGVRKSAAFIAAQPTRFRAGHEPWNTGLKGWTAPGRSAETRFAKRNKPHNTLPLGSHRINKDGHLQRKVAEASGSNSKRWRGVAELVWVEAHGPLPPKHIVVFRPGQFTAELAQITLERVECISLAENARRNHPRTKSPELGRLVQLKGAITRQVNRINREHKEARA